MSRSHWNRRQMLGGMAGGAAWFTVSGLFAEELAKTPALTEGPFYPDKLPLDVDNDLLIVGDGTTPAIGEITHLAGRILGPTGTPLRNAVVEIWQVDNNGAYLHSRDPNQEKRDANFQGYGRFLTDSKGQYYFRTIKPPPYTGRCPHIHFGISQNGRRIYTTQLFIRGHELNDRDMVFRGIREAADRQRVMTDFAPLADSRIGELAANWDIVLGVTPQDPDEAVQGSYGPPERMRRRRG